MSHFKKEEKKNMGQRGPKAVQRFDASRPSEHHFRNFTGHQGFYPWGTAPPLPGADPGYVKRGGKIQKGGGRPGG